MQYLFIQSTSYFVIIYLKFCIFVMEPPQTNFAQPFLSSFATRAKKHFYFSKIPCSVFSASWRHCCRRHRSARARAWAFKICQTYSIYFFLNIFAARMNNTSARKHIEQFIQKVSVLKKYFYFFLFALCVVLFNYILRKHKWNICFLNL